MKLNTCMSQTIFNFRAIFATVAWSDLTVQKIPLFSWLGCGTQILKRHAFQKRQLYAEKDTSLNQKRRHGLNLRVRLERRTMGARVSFYKIQIMCRTS